MSTIAVYEGTVKRAWVSRSGWLVVETEKAKPVAWKKWVGKLPAPGTRVSVEADEGSVWFFAKHRDAADVSDQGRFDPCGLSNYDDRNDIVQRLILSWLDDHEQVTGDDIHEAAMRRFPGSNPNFIGIGFSTLAKAGAIHMVGYKKAKRDKARARVLTVWERTLT